MNILLANMPINFNKRENLEPPLGISYIGAVLRDEGHSIFLKDYEIENFSEGEIDRFIEDKAIDIVGISFRTASYRSAKIFTQSLNRSKYKIKVIAGGHHATAFSKETLQDLALDVIVRGEGEYTAIQLVNALAGGKSLEAIKGITYNDKGKIIYNQDSPQIIELDKLPFPARDMLPYDSYTLATIITSRGCPFSCIYCDKGISTKKVQFRSEKNIIAEIESITKQFKKHRLYIVDDHFFLKKDRTHAILDRIISMNIDIKWVCQARADGVDEAILVKAKKSGCEQIMFGLETGDEMELRNIKKQSTLAQAERAIALTKKAGIKARTNFMLGFPFSTHESTKNTIKFAKKIESDIVRFFAVTPLPNTELWDSIYGRDADISAVNWGNFDFYNPNFETKELTREDISLYVLAGYWHVLKKKFVLETTVFLLPGLAKLVCKVIKTGRLRGNISLYFPAAINLIRDTLPPILKKGPISSLKLLRSAMRLEKKIR